MPSVKVIQVKESLKELSVLRKNSTETVSKRLLMLIEIKKNKGQSLAKRELSRRIGVDPNSITNWKKLYEEQGIDGMIIDGRIGFKPSVINKEEHKAIKKLLHNPRSGIRGYTELLQWVKTELGKDMLYITLLKYVERNFNSKIKIARKSHVKKNEEAVTAFKKTLVKSVRK